MRGSASLDRSQYNRRNRVLTQLRPSPEARRLPFDESSPALPDRESPPARQRPIVSQAGTNHKAARRAGLKTVGLAWQVCCSEHVRPSRLRGLCVDHKFKLGRSALFMIAQCRR